jgi:hypothetical protein
MLKKSNRLFMARAAAVSAVMVLPRTFFREELYQFLGSLSYGFLLFIITVYHKA